MPIKNRAANRAYQRAWVAEKRALESPEERLARLIQRREYRQTPAQVRKRRAYDRKHGAENARRKADWKLQKNYGEFADAKRLLLTLMKLTGK